MTIPSLDRRSGASFRTEMVNVAEPAARLHRAVAAGQRLL
jgi:hypothetical protein